MNNPKLVVIDDEQIIGDIIKDIPWKEGLNFDVDVYLKYPKIEQIRDASLYVIDKNFGKGEDGLRLAEELKEKGELGARIMLTAYTNEQAQTKAINEGLVDKWLVKPDVVNNLMDTVSILRNERKLIQKREIGIYGMGSSGIEIIKRAKVLPGVSKVHAFSNFAKGDYKYLECAVGLHNKSKVIFHKSLESLVESNPDIFFITTGEHGIDFSKPINRNDVFESSAKKVKPLFEILGKQKYDGLVCNFANPVGPILHVAEMCGLNPKKLTGVSTNAFRTQALLSEYIPCEIDDVKAVSIGEHGGAIIPYDYCLVGDKPLLEVVPEFKNSYTVKKFETELKEKGLNDMRSNQDLRLGYEDAPEAILRVLDDILCLQKNARESLYCYFEPGVLGKQGAFLGWEEKINYPSLEIERALRVEDLDEKTYNIMANQAVQQNKLVEGVLNARK